MRHTDGTYINIGKNENLAPKIFTSDNGMHPQIVLIDFYLQVILIYKPAAPPIYCIKYKTPPRCFNYFTKY